MSNCKNRKILLIKPHKPYFPLGLGYVISSLLKNGYDYDYFDCHLDSFSELEKLIKNNKYLAIATGGLVADFAFISKLFEFVKRIDPITPCILGGNITSSVKAELLFKGIFIDYIAIGECEHTFPALLENLHCDESGLRNINGIAFKSAESQITVTARREIVDLKKENCIPNWRSVNTECYGKPNMISTGRGCVGNCAFCAPTNGRFRGRKLEFIIEEIDSMLKLFNPPSIWFSNEVFFPEEEQIYEFCRIYKNLFGNIPWACALRADINTDVLKVMKDAGCFSINVGVESGSNRVLKAIKKDTNTSMLQKFIETTNKLNIANQASVMFGNYSETAEEIEKTVDFVINNRAGGGGGAALCITYPGTLNYVRAKKQNLIGDELEYIKSLENIFGISYFEQISKVRSGTASYLNLTSMNDDELFRVVEKEERRYYSQHKVRDIKLNYINNDNVTISGNCYFGSSALCSAVRLTQEITGPLAQ